MKAMRDAKEGSGKSWRKRLGGLVTTGRSMRSLLMTSRIKRGVDINKVKITEDGAAWQQGDATMYTEEALRARAALRHDAAVLEALHSWWTTALQTLWHEGYCPADGEAAMLDEMAYKKIYMRVCHAMALSSGEEFNRTEAVACADEDWKADSHGGVGMPRELFMDASGI
mgnify:CR=1 FL=1